MMTIILFVKSVKSKVARVKANLSVEYLNGVFEMIIMDVI